MSKTSANQRATKRSKKRTATDGDGDTSNVKPFESVERLSQVTLQMRQSLHRELSRRAFDSNMTMRGYIMRALQKSGLGVTDADLIDRRRRED